MSRTLYIVDDNVYQSIDTVARQAMLTELGAIFGFVKDFAVKPTKPAAFPRSPDMSDSVVRIAATSDDGDTVINSAWRKQYNISRKGIRAAGFKLDDYSPPHRFPGDPERHGSAFHGKHIAHGGGKKIAIPLMAGWVALASLKEEVDALTKKAAAPKATARPHLEKAPAPKATPPGAPKTASPPKAPSPKPAPPTAVDLKAASEMLGRFIARAVAHEARHEYIAEHADIKLGSDSAVLEDGNDTRFDKDDQDAIRRAIEKFEADQRGAILIPMVPTPDDFPY